MFRVRHWGCNFRVIEVVGSIPTSDIETFEAVLASKRPQRPDMSSDLKPMAQTT